MIKLEEGMKLKRITMDYTSSYLNVYKEMLDTREVVVAEVWESTTFEDEDGFVWDVQDFVPVIEETKPKYIVTEDSITLSYKGSTETINDSSEKFSEVLNCILSKQFDKALEIMNTSLAIEAWGQGLLEVKSGVVNYNGMNISNKLVDRIIKMMQEGDKDFEKYAKCLNMTLEQVSLKTRERIMDFVACNKITIDNNGYVIAFKNVDNNYMDKHTGKFRNMVGDTPSMPRSEVDDDHNNTCSKGLHVCSPTYLSRMWGTSGKTLKVKVDPRDFVAIPYDYSDSKARVCKYEVIEDVTNSIDEYL